MAEPKMSAFDALQTYKRQQPTAQPEEKTTPTKTSNKPSAFEALQAFKKTPTVKKEPAKAQPEPALPPGFKIPAPDLAGFDSRSSTQTIPSAPQVAYVEKNVIKPLLTATSKGNDIYQQARDSENPFARAGAAVVRSTRDTALQVFDQADRFLTPDSVFTYEGREPPTTRERAIAAGGLLLNVATLGLVDFVAGAAPEIVGATVAGTRTLDRLFGRKTAGDVNAEAKVAQQQTQDFIDHTLGEKGLFGLFQQLGFSQKEAADLSIVLPIAGMYGLAKVSHFKADGAMRGNIAKDSVDLTRSMSEVLGVEVKMGKDGTPIVPNPKETKAAFDRVVADAQGKPYSVARIEAAKSAHDFLVEYNAAQKSGVKLAEFRAKWDPIIERGANLGNQIADQVVSHVDEAVTEQRTSDVNTVLREKDVPIRERNAVRVRLMGDEAGRLAFEQEIHISSTKSDAERTSVAASRGATFERDTFSVSDQPAQYQDGRIIFNEPAIQDTVTRVYDAASEKGATVRIKTGEGSTTSFSEVKLEPGESMLDFRTKYEDALFDHELAHHELEVRDPEMRAKRQQMAEAQAAGDFQTADRLRRDLERAAETQVKIVRVEEPKKPSARAQEGEALTPKETATIEKEVSQVLKREELRAKAESFRYQDPVRETAYQEWRRTTKKNTTERTGKDWEGYKKSVEESKIANKAEVLRKIDDAAKNLTNDQLLDSFRERARQEARFREEVAQARDARKAERATKQNQQTRQGKLIGKAQEGKPSLAKQIRQMVRGELENIFSNKRDNTTRKAELSKLKQRILDRQKLLNQKELTESVREKARQDIKAAKEEMRNLYENRLDDAARKAELSKLRQRIEDRFRIQKREAKIAELREKIKTGKASQQEISDYLRANRIPYEVRGKFITDLKNAKTPEDVALVIREIDREFNAYQRDRSKARIEKLLEKNNQKGAKATVSPEAQKAIDQVREYAKMSRSDINEKIVEIVDKYEDQRINGELPEEAARQIELLEMGGLEGQNARQMLRTEAQLRQIIKDGKTLREAKIQRDRERIKAVHEGVAEKLTGSNILDAKTEPVQIKRGFVKELWNRFVTRKINKLELLNDLSIELGPKYEEFTARASQNVQKAEQTFNRQKIETLDKMKEVYGKDHQYEYYKIQNSQMDLGEARYSDGETRPVRYTRGQMIQIYMYLKNEGTAIRLKHEKGNALSPAVLNKIDKALTPQDKAMGDWLVDHGYAGFADPLVQAAKDVNGIVLGKQKNYAGPVSSADPLGANDPLKNMTMGDLLNDSANYQVSMKPGFIQKRIEKVGPIKITSDPVGAYLRYAETADRYIHAGREMLDAAALLANKTVNKIIDARLGKDFRGVLESQMDDITNAKSKDFGPESLMQRTSHNVAGFLIHRWSVAIGQPAAIFGFKAELTTSGAGDYAKWSDAFNWKKEKANLDKYIPALEVRTTQAFPDTAGSTKLGIKSKAGIAFERFKFALQKLSGVEKMDSVTAYAGSNMIFQAKTRQFLAEGNTLEQARVRAGRYANEALARSQPGSSPLVKGAAFKKDNIFLALKQAPAKIALQQRRIMRLYQEGRISRGTAIKATVEGAVLQGAVYHLLKISYKTAKTGALIWLASAIGAKAWKKKQEEQMKETLSLKTLVGGTAINVAQGYLGYPYVDDAASIISDNLIFDKNFEYRPALVSAAFSDANRAIAQFKTGDYDEASLLGMRTIAAFAGVPDVAGAIQEVLGYLSIENAKKRKKK